MSQVWLITGASRGLGAAIAQAALAAGHRVVATARDAAHIHATLGQDGERLRALALDVTDAAAVDQAVAQAHAAFGRLDVLVNNAGYGQMGAFEEIEPAAIERQFATNVFGLMNVTRAVLPFMRQQRSGHIFNIASVAGYKGGPRFSVYAASKFAVAGFSESLAAELREFDIRVTAVEPGYFRTDFLDASSLVHGTRSIADYAESSERFREQLAPYNHQQAGDPARLGAALISLAAAATPPRHFPVGADAIEWIESKHAAVTKDVESWRELSVATAFDS